MLRRRSSDPTRTCSSRSRTALNPLELTLGVMTAVGGFVDISELVFAAKAGSTFGYALISVFVFATIGIMVFGEMSGRVAAIANKPVFNLLCHRLCRQHVLLCIPPYLDSPAVEWRLIV